MKTKLENLEQFQDWFMNLSDSVKLREINEALSANRMGILCINTDSELRNAIEVMFGNDVLRVYRNLDKVCVGNEALFYCDPYSEEIYGVNWYGLDEFIECELSNGWEFLAEQMNVIFEE